MALISILRRLRTIPPQNAAAKLATWNPGTMDAASLIIRALTTNQKIPSVSRVRGKVTIFRKSPRVALMNPINTAAISAAVAPLTLNPGTRRDTIQMASALSTQCTSIRSMGSSPGVRTVTIRPGLVSCKFLSIEYSP